MKVYRRYSDALKAAEGRPVFRVAGLHGKAIYVVVESKFQEVSIVITAPGRGHGATTGHVTAHHLDRLGNANWATPNTNTALNNCAYSAFPEEVAS